MQGEIKKRLAIGFELSNRFWYLLKIWQERSIIQSKKSFSIMWFTITMCHVCVVIINRWIQDYHHFYWWFSVTRKLRTMNEKLNETKNSFFNLIFVVVYVLWFHGLLQPKGLLSLYDVVIKVGHETNVRKW
jgi:hypothetical protein